MSHVFHRLYFHFIWRFHHESSVLEEDARQSLLEDIRVACGERGVEVMACNAMPDHLHLAVRLRPSDAPATFIGQVKGAASFAFNRRFENRLRIKWQDGYGTVSFREGDLDRVVAYVQNQQSIHAKRRASRFLEMAEEAPEEPEE